MVWFITRILTIISTICSTTYAFPKPPQKQKTILTSFQPYHLRPYNSKIILPKCSPDDPLCELPPPIDIHSISPNYFLPGIKMGVPLNLISWAFINYYYGMGSEGAILSPQLIILNCLVGLYTYGMDRMMDATVWGNTGASQEVKKATLYQYILENYDVLKNIYDSTYWMFAMILMATPDNGIRPQTLVFLIVLETLKFSVNLRYTFFSYYLGIYGYRLWAIYICIFAAMTSTHWFDHELLYLPLLLVLETSRYYPTIKKRWGLLKAFYVGAMWTGAIAVMPILIYEHSYNSLKDTSLLVPFLGMTALSNIADIKDIKEDEANCIYTIPVLIGRPFSFLVSMNLLFMGFYVWKNHSLIF